MELCRRQAEPEGLAWDMPAGRKARPGSNPTGAPACPSSGEREEENRQRSERGRERAWAPAERAREMNASTVPVPPIHHPTSAVPPKELTAEMSLPHVSQTTAGRSWDSPEPGSLPPAGLCSLPSGGQGPHVADCPRSPPPKRRKRRCWSCCACLTPRLKRLSVLQVLREVWGGALMCSW